MAHFASRAIAFASVSLLAVGAFAGPADDVKPTVLAPGLISGPANDTDFGILPDGQSAVFARESTILVTRRAGASWSKPTVAPFSGVWRDQQPSLSPDGKFLVFVSNRPIASGDTTRPFGNLWRVDHKGTGWSEPVHLPAAVNRTNSTWAPSVAGDGSLYFIERPDANSPLRLWRSQWKDGAYQPAVAISFGDATTQDVDPAVAPDESFIVFGSMHPGPDAHERLFIAFRSNNEWGKPVDLGDAVNGPSGRPGDTNEPRLSPDKKTLYYSSDRTMPLKFPRTRAQAEADLERVQAWDDGNINIWTVPLAPWLDGKGV